MPITYSNIQGGYPGEGNIDLDPLFISTNNLRLSPNSPCIDAGDNRVVPQEILADLDGNPRFTDDCSTEDTGIPDPPNNRIVDMGAYEYQPNDVDNDGDYDLADLAEFMVCFGEAVVSPGCKGFDADCNGELNLEDFELITSGPR